MNKILLVDDDHLQLRVLSRQLQNLGYRQQQLLTSASASEALATLEFEAGRIELLFLDLNMPDIDGVEMLRQLAASRYGGGLVLVSGEQPRILESAVRLASAHGLSTLGSLSKPCQPEQLATLLGHWQQQQQCSASRSMKVYSEAEVRQALLQRELVNVYQPKVRLQDGMPVSLEALVRWQHSLDGLVMPAQFVGVAEEHGLINDLTRMVISQAIADLKWWRAAGLDWAVAVNVSMEDLVSLDLPEYIAQLLQQHDLPPALLTLEVTESRLMINRRASLEVLTRLCLRRVGLSIDDFGTGHSSLTQLRDLPFDELKIDRSFVHGAAADPALAAIAAGSFSMAQQLNMATVAEGVEDRADWDWLREHCCDLAQGYFIGRPMQVSELAQWQQDWLRRLGELQASIL